MIDSKLLWQIIIGSSIVASVASKILEEGLGFIKEVLLENKRLAQKKKEHIISKQLEIHEDLFKHITGLAPNYSPTWNQDVLTKISAVEILLIEKNLYITDEIKNIAYEARDYYLRVATGVEVHDVQFDIRFQERFKSKFLS